MSSRSETLKSSSADGVFSSTPPCSSSSSRFGGSAAAAAVDDDDDDLWEISIDSSESSEGISVVFSACFSMR